MRAPQESRSGLRLFATHAVVCLVPVALLGAALAYTYRAQAQDRGLTEAKDKATLLAKTGIEPQLDDTPIGNPMSEIEDSRLRRLVYLTTGEGQVLRLRLRDLSGHVVFSDDGSGFAGPADDEALEAARGETIGLLTRINKDSNDAGPAGVQAVEVYVPLQNSKGATIGVLETYLPYAPISEDVNVGLHHLYQDLALGLAALYLTLFGIAWSVSRGLRRQVTLNAFLAEHDVEIVASMPCYSPENVNAFLAAKVRSQPVGM